MKRSLPGVIVLLQLLGLGCANTNTVYRELDVNGGKGVLIDIKQRAILVRASPLRVCAEPSPDALAAYAAEVSAKLDTAAKTAIGVSVASQEAASFVGLRTSSIQLLRDSLYRVCEMYLNGAIDDLQYQMLVRRYQKYTVALLAIEQLTSAVRVQASTPLTPKAPAEAPAPAPSKTPPPTPAASSSASALEATPAPSSGDSLSTVATVVREIVMDILRTDDEAQLCIAYMKEGNLNGELMQICTEYVNVSNQIYLEARRKQMTLEPPVRLTSSAPTPRPTTGAADRPKPPATLVHPSEESPAPANSAIAKPKK